VAEYRYLTDAEFQDDVKLSGKEMPDGERRYRLIHEESGMSVSLTERPAGRGGWQLAHSHAKDIRETYSIHTGWVVLASLEDGELICAFYEAGSTFTVQSGDPHTLYVDGGTIFGTVKYGPDHPGIGWVAAPDLDALVRDMTGREAQQRALA
jgi:hypothetical protein